EDNATLTPKRPAPVSSLAVSFEPCWVQGEPARGNTHAAPTLLLLAKPPISAVLPSEDNATLEPNWPAPVSSLAVSFCPCWVRGEPARVNTHAAPTLLLSMKPPISAVLPSEDNATLRPNWPAPVSSLAVSFEPCWISGSMRSGYRA